MARRAVLAVMSVFLLAGCAAEPKASYSTVLVGMSRNNLRSFFGKPLRIEPNASGGEDWYYRFSSVQARPTGSSGRNDNFGEQTSYISVGVEFSKQVTELPVHVSSDGFVVRPLPKGKVVKN